MTNLRLKTVFAAVGIFLSGAACGTELSGQWNLAVENPEHVVVASLKVEFTDKKAPSCMAGEWKVLKVVSATTRDSNFFPSSDPLSYRIENKKVTIGRNELCDAYLWLQGPLEGTSVKGDYFSFGLGGGTTRGYFRLSQTR